MIPPVIALAHPRPLVVPILRAGLGMLEGMTRLIPTAEVGFLGMARDDTTLDIITYAERLPDDLTGRQVYVLDFAFAPDLLAQIDATGSITNAARAVGMDGHMSKPVELSQLRELIEHWIAERELRRQRDALPH